MLYVYRRAASTSARDLAETIMVGVEGVRGLIARRTRGDRLRNLAAGDQVVCLGEHFAAPDGVRTLNNVAIIDKFHEAQRLAAAGVSTIQVSRTRPVARAAARAAFVPNRLNLNGGHFGDDELARIEQAIRNHREVEARRLAQHNNQPAVPAENWLPRRNNHVGGNDLLQGNIADPAFYSKRENVVEEYRLHMFKGKSIRAGRKVADPQRVARPHEWIRSFDAGWTIRYDGFESTRAMRDLGAAALTALGLDFGAVDIGRRADGSFLVFEVNRAPGMEGGTLEAYAKAIINWVRNPNGAARE